MKAFLLLVVIFLFSCQAVPGNAQSDPDSLTCYRTGGSCRPDACRPPSVNVGSCKGGTENCCKWPRQGSA